ncbi:MAG TPA: choice-of-anchor D domain-containing protein [Candidatus Acidoferrales bacterium]|nr:choice-of-anchor D domain-containing protein [Candidatus Acidoferrales bacterium]
MAVHTSRSRCSVTEVSSFNRTFNRTFTKVSCSLLAAAGAWLAGCSGLVQQSRTETSGHLSVSPATASFGSVGVGTKQTQTVLLMSDGAVPVTIRSVKPSGAGFSVGQLIVPTTLPPGASTPMTISFTPAAAQSATGNVVIVSDAANGSLSLELSGTGTTASRTLVPSVAQVNFGDVLVGGSDTFSITLTNQGNSALTIQSVSGTGSGFGVTGFANGTSVAPGQTTAFNVTFAPTALGAAAGQVVVTSNATTSLVIPLSGTAVERSAHAVELSWDQGTDVTGYNVYRQAAGGSDFVKINGSTLSTPQFSDINVASGATYVYVVTSVANDGTESPQSDPVTVEIPD